MDKHPLDQLFQKKLQDHKRAPSPEAWDRLESMLGAEPAPTARPKRAKWWMVAAAVLFLGTSLGLWQMYPVSSPEQISGQQASSKEKTAKELEKIEPTQKNTNNTAPRHAESLTEHHSEKSLREKHGRKQAPASQTGKEATEKLAPRQKKQDKKLFLENTKDPAFAVNDLEIEVEVEPSLTEEEETKQERTSYAIKVTVKLSGASSGQETMIARQDSAEEDEFFKKKTSKKKDKNKEFKIFGVDPDKIWASLGK